LYNLFSQYYSTFAKLIDVFIVIAPAGYSLPSSSAAIDTYDLLLVYCNKYTIFVLYAHMVLVIYELEEQGKVSNGKHIKIHNGQMN